jgi:hypothetical protein
MSENTAAKTRTAEEPSSTTDVVDEPTRPATPGAPSVETRRFSWRPRRGVRKRALFRVTVHGAILQHVRTTRLQQRGGPSETTLDAGAALEDVPEWVRDELRRDGHALVAGGVA